MREFMEERKITHVAPENLRSCYERFLEEFEAESLHRRIDKYRNLGGDENDKADGCSQQQD